MPRSERKKTKKLHLKRTPAEQAAHDLRKAQKAARRRTDDDGSAGPSHGEDPDVFARVEEERFHEKLADAAMDDLGLDGVRARLSSYGARVPRRWAEEGDGDDGRGGMEDVDPWGMGEEEYAEWVRAGMWRKKNAAEVEAQRRRKAAQDAAEAEAARMMKAKEEARVRKRRERAMRREDEARAAYEVRWGELLSVSKAETTLGFEDVPWPVFEGADPNAESVRAFLLGEGSGEGKTKEAVRRTLLRFHPDKFESRVLARVREGERERVRAAAGAVVRAVAELVERRAE